MGSIRTILESVIDNGTSGKKVEIKPITRGEYETIRTRLVKLWSKTRENLLAIGSDAAEYSISEFHEEKLRRSIHSKSSTTTAANNKKNNY